MPKVNTIKASNPKDAIGSRKVPFHLVPSHVIGECALGMLEGACKYGAHNYRVIGVRATVYTNAAKRHIEAWQEGQDIDPDSGLNHITKALTTLIVLRDAMLQDKLYDDRPPADINPNWVADLNIKADLIIARYPNPLPPHLQKDLTPCQQPRKQPKGSALSSPPSKAMRPTRKR